MTEQISIPSVHKKAIMKAVRARINKSDKVPRRNGRLMPTTISLNTEHKIAGDEPSFMVRWENYTQCDYVQEMVRKYPTGGWELTTGFIVRYSEMEKYL